MLTITPLQNIPLIQPGDDLAEIIWIALTKTSLQLKDGDILVLAQKIVSKAEGRLVNLNSVTPTQYAFELAHQTGKDPRFLELVLRESNEVLRTIP